MFVFLYSAFVPLNLALALICFFFAVVILGYALWMSFEGWSTEEEKQQVKSQVKNAFLAFFILLGLGVLGLIQALVQILGLLFLVLCLRLAFKALINVVRLFLPDKAKRGEYVHHEDGTVQTVSTEEKRKGRYIKLPGGEIGEVLTDDGNMPEGYVETA